MTENLNTFFPRLKLDILQIFYQERNDCRVVHLLWHLSCSERNGMNGVLIISSSINQDISPSMMSDCWSLSQLKSKDDMVKMYLLNTIPLFFSPLKDTERNIWIQNELLWGFRNNWDSSWHHHVPSQTFSDCPHCAAFPAPSDSPSTVSPPHQGSWRTSRTEAWSGLERFIWNHQDIIVHQHPLETALICALLCHVLN